jgi:3'-5' exonuclease
MEVLSFWNARHGEGNLDFWCRQFGITSPKTGLDGSAVESAYKEGRLEDIARYCIEDTRATAQLYLRLMHIIRLAERDASVPSRKCVP